MATLPAMVNLIAVSDGRPVQAIEHLARFIRERGYIQNGKRGGGAPQMNTTDAANLLIALCGSESPADAPLAIDRFRSLRPKFEGTADMIREYVDQIERLPEPLRNVMQCQTFGTAIEALIDGATDLLVSIMTYLKDAYPGTSEDGLTSLYRLKTAGLRVEFSASSAAIRLYRTGREGIVTDFLSEYMVDIKRPPAFYGADKLPSDRVVTVTVGLDTLLRCQASTIVAAAE